MDLRAAAQELLPRETDEVDPSLKALFVAPKPREIPNDGFTRYDVLTSIYQFQDAPERSCILVNDEDIPVLKVVCDNPSIFGLHLIRIEGIAGADYSPEWEAATWALDRVSYNALVAEFSMVAEAEQALKARDATVHDREKEQYTRANGSVKDNTNFELAEDDE